MAFEPQHSGCSKINSTAVSPLIFKNRIVFISPKPSSELRGSSVRLEPTREDGFQIHRDPARGAAAGWRMATRSLHDACCFSAASGQQRGYDSGQNDRASVYMCHRLSLPVEDDWSDDEPVILTANRGRMATMAPISMWPNAQQSYHKRRDCAVFMGSVREPEQHCREPVRPGGWLGKFSPESR